MPLFPLDCIRNAKIDRRIEVALEELRESLETGQKEAPIEHILEMFDVARPRLNVLASLLSVGQTATIGADISSGFGFLAALLTKLGHRVEATEVDVELPVVARRAGVLIHPYRLGGHKPPFERMSLEFVVFSEVLEHLKLSPVTVLKELASLLVDGGHLLLSTPNVARLSNIEQLVRGENFLEPFPEALDLCQDATDYIEHVREYSAREVVESVEAAGLSVDSVVMTGWGPSGYDLHSNPLANDILVVLASR